MRHEVCFVVRLESTDGHARAAVVRDASDSGVFILTHGATLEVGAEVELELVPLATGDPTPRVRGHVVRARKWDAGDLWRYGLGIRLEGAWSPDLAIRELAAMSRLAARPS